VLQTRAGQAGQAGQQRVTSASGAARVGLFGGAEEARWQGGKVGVRKAHPVVTEVQLLQVGQALGGAAGRPGLCQPPAPTGQQCVERKGKERKDYLRYASSHCYTCVH